ncbi:MAG: BON domain-containing protein [Chloroflexi bacterium]|nr:BON domain-containing protein [Chloroflexota bacterium]
MTQLYQPNEGMNMLPVQTSTIDTHEISRCEEQPQVKDHGRKLNPIQKTDLTIKESIYHAFWKDDVLRAVEYDQIDVDVKNGIAYLNGHIVSTSSQARIENALRVVPDILGIRNNLVLDDKLIMEVASSLGRLEHTYKCKFFTGASHGVVSLNGVVGNEKIKLLVEKVVANNSKVRGVINNVRDSTSKLELKDQTFLQPVIGEVIYFHDGISGVVKQVIINPNNRLVIAMILQGNFTDARFESNSSTYGKLQIPEQLVIVPMDAVRYLTKVSGFLFIHSNERTRYLDFDPDIYIAPDHAWTPPYPYCPKDVLFPAEYQNAHIQIADEPEEFPFGAIVEDASIREQFFATDSMGL